MTAYGQAMSSKRAMTGLNVPGGVLQYGVFGQRLTMSRIAAWPASVQASASWSLPGVVQRYSSTVKPCSRLWTQPGGTAGSFRP